MFNRLRPILLNNFRGLSGFITLVIPFLLFVYLAAYQFNLPENEILVSTATVSFSVSMIVAWVLFSKGLRLFLPTAIIAFVLGSLYLIFSRESTGEFTYFFNDIIWGTAVLFCVFAWILTWSIQRNRFVYYVCLFVVFLYSGVSLYYYYKSSINSFLYHATYWLLALFYFIAVFELWFRFDFNRVRGVFRFSIRYVFYVCSLFVFIFFSDYIVSKIILSNRKLIAKQDKETNQQLDSDSNGNLRNRQSMGLRGRNNRMPDKHTPLFCAHINLTMGDGLMQNPLYLTAFHFNTFDTLTETFERNVTSLFNDEFVPIPNELPFYLWHTDSAILSQYDTLPYSKIVETEVYLNKLSPKSFVAPSTAYAVQPFMVDAEFSNTFKFAYKTRSKVSALNSAYLIYNTRDPFLKLFQEQRYAILRKVAFENKLADNFLNYYTQFPASGKYAPLKRLADSLAQGKSKAIDKILAVRDYFAHIDASGNPRFSYTDNPGIPGLPGASNLLYFMFESKRGYCAYYAASTVALLRLMKLPARVVTGFLTIDRSDKNSGWYWYYADQAHAWVQVYFPGYGWIDFDTTIGDEDAREAPRPDGTPPSTPKEATISWLGTLDAVDTIKKLLHVRVQQVQWGERQIKTLGIHRTFKINHAVIKQDTQVLTMPQLSRFLPLVVISYSPSFLNKNNDTLLSSAELAWSKPYDADAVFILQTIKKKSVENAKSSQSNSAFPKHVLYLLACLIISFLILPYAHYRYLRWRAYHTSISLPRNLNYFLYLFYMSGIKPQNASLQQFAEHSIDSAYNLSFAQWLQLYWQSQYAKHSISEEKGQYAMHLAKQIDQSFSKQLTPWKRVSRWFRYDAYIGYWLNFYKYKKLKS